MPTDARRGKWMAILEARLGKDRIQTDVALAPFSTFRIGGPADLFLRARTNQELVTGVSTARELGIPLFLMGRGANVLVSDEGFRGMVIRNEVGGVEFLPKSRIRAGAGVEVYPDLIEAAVRRGLGGLHHYAGIPSTVGGALWQNLHFLSPAPLRSRTLFIEEVVESALLLTQEGAVREVDREYFHFGYDYSILHDRFDVVLSAVFQLEEEDPSVLRNVIRENLDWRAQRHPDLARHPSAGSIFKKVEGIGAGRLIDQCGLKGAIRGGAQIFPGHANIIVNLGGARASDVMELIRLARETVLRDTGHELEPEITFVGNVGDFLPNPHSI